MDANIIPEETLNERLNAVEHYLQQKAEHHLERQVAYTDMYAAFLLLRNKNVELANALKDYKENTVGSPTVEPIKGGER